MKLKKNDTVLFNESISLKEINTGPCGSCSKSWRCNFIEKYRVYRIGYCDFRRKL